MDIDPLETKQSEAQLGRSFRLRPFYSGDFPKLLELDQICFRPGIAYSEEDLEAFLFHVSSIAVVAEAPTGAIAGFAILELYREKKKVIGHVVTLDVHPDFRRLGLGRKLMISLERLAQGHHAECMRLEVAADDEGAQTFYSKLGFTVVRRVKKYYMNRLDALVMERPLSSAVPPAAA